MKKQSVKLVSVFSAILFVLTVIGVWPIVRSVENAAIKSIVECSLSYTKLTGIIFQSVYKEASADLLHHAGVVSQYADKPTQETKLEIAQDLTNLAHKYQHYSSIVLVGVSGKEELKISYTGQNAYVVADDDLDDVRDTSYYKSTIALQHGQVFVSSMVLNTDFYTNIELPYRPVVHFSTPVYSRIDDKLKGILVFTLDTTYMLNKLREAYDNQDFINNMVLNKSAYWVLDSMGSHEWAFMFSEQKDYNFAFTYPEVWRHMTNIHLGHLNTQDGLFVFREFNAVESAHVFGDTRFYVVRKFDRGFIDFLLFFASPNVLFGLSVFYASVFFLFVMYARNSLYNTAEYKSTKDREKFLTNVIEAMPDAVVISDIEGKIVHVNNAFTVLFGYSNEEIIGRGIEILVPHSLRSKHEKYRSYYFRHQKNRVMRTRSEMNAVNKKGTVIQTLTHLNTIPNTGGNLVIAVIQNIEMTRKLISEKEAAQIAHAEKSRFIANISHELRTPMNGILGFANLIPRKTVDPDVLDYTNKILYSARRMMLLINDMLVLSKLEAHKTFSLFQNTDVVELVKEAVKEMQSLLTKKQLVCIYVGPDSAHAELDKTQIYSVVINLLANAIKYSPSSTIITVSVDWIVQGNIECVQIAVQDQGVGVPKENIDNIFNPFFQTSRSDFVVEDSTGLGLSICKELVSLHRGKIWAQSPPSDADEGSVFYVVLPVVQREKSTQLDVIIREIDNVILAHSKLLHSLDAMFAGDGIPVDIQVTTAANVRFCSSTSFLYENRFVSFPHLDSLREYHNMYHMAVGECLSSFRTHQLEKAHKGRDNAQTYFEKFADTLEQLKVFVALQEKDNVKPNV